MLGLFDVNKRLLVEKLWASNEGSVQQYWDTIKSDKYYTDRIAKQIEYTDYVVTYRYLNALLTEATAVDSVCPNPSNQLDRVLAGSHLREMKSVLDDMAAVNGSVNDTLEESMVKLLDYKKRFLLRYATFLDCMDNLSMHIRQKVQVIEGQGTYLHSSCYLGSGDNTVLILQQRITATEVVFKYER